MWCTLSPGSHSLSYFETTMSRPGIRDPRYIFIGYVDDMQFVHFDSDAQSQRLEPRALWVEQIPPKRWEQEIQRVKNNKLNARDLLLGAISEYNQSQDGE